MLYIFGQLGQKQFYLEQILNVVELENGAIVFKNDQNKAIITGFVY